MCSAKERISFRIEDILKTDKPKTVDKNKAVTNDSKRVIVKKSDDYVKSNESHVYNNTASFITQRENELRLNNPIQRNKLNFVNQINWQKPDLPFRNAYYHGAHYSNQHSGIFYHQYPLAYHQYPLDRGNPYGWNSYLSHLPGLVKRKGGQVRFTSHQTNTLEGRFASNKYLSPEDRRVLAAQLKLSDRQVKTWFQNRRAKWRRSASEGRRSSDDVSKDGDDDNDVNVDIVDVTDDDK